MPDSPQLNEKQMLSASLNRQREHVLGILDGLSEDALRRPTLPSGWSCLGLVQHLALDVERFWFREIAAGEKIGAGEWSEAEESAWQVASTTSANAVLRLYRDETERANGIIDSTDLDAPPAWWPVELWPDWRYQNLRQITLHVTTETACHAGHLDAARELIDGRQWVVLE